MVAAAMARGSGCGSANSKSWPTNSASSSSSATPAFAGAGSASRHQQVEQDRAPALLLHQPELARPAARQPSRDCRADLGYHHQNRPHRALRTRHWPIPQRHCRLRRRNGRHQHQTRRIPRRVELHHLTEYLPAKLRVYFVTNPKLEKLEALLALAAPTDEDVALLADLLSSPPSERYPLPNLSPQRKKERTLEPLI